MTFEFLDVGMGDATFVMMGANTKSTQEMALIDFGLQPFTKFKVGRDDAAVYLVRTIGELSKQRQLANPQIDHVFITHPDRDHYNEIVKLINRTDYPNYFGKTLKIGKLTIGGNANEYTNFSEILKAVVDQNSYILDNNCHSTINGDGTVVPLFTFVKGAVKVYLLSANYPSRASDDANQKSLCLMFETGGNKMIFMGDAEGQVEANIIENFKGAKAGFLNAYGLKLGHHGSKAGTTQEWINAVKPSAIFATGDFVWAHPYCEPINRVANSKVLKSTTLYRRFVCGESTREYFNNHSQLQIALNLWYVVKEANGQTLVEESDKSTYNGQQGLTLGVQWELEFENGATGGVLNRTDTSNPQ